MSKTVAPIKPWFILLVIVISVLLLIPGITEPMLSIHAKINGPALMVEGAKLIKENLPASIAGIATQFLAKMTVPESYLIHDTTHSIFSSSQKLWMIGYPVVAACIVIFSVIIPTIKLLMLGLIAVKDDCRQYIKFNSFLSKWSMADVFAIGIIIAFLFANASDQSPNTVMSLSAELHDGYYWFLAYCLTSNALSMLVAKMFTS